MIYQNLIPQMKKVVVLVCSLLLYKCSTMRVELQGFPLKSIQASEQKATMRILEELNYRHTCTDMRLTSIVPIQEEEQSYLMHSVRSDLQDLELQTPSYIQITTPINFRMFCGSISCTAGNTLEYE